MKQALWPYHRDTHSMICIGETRKVPDDIKGIYPPQGPVDIRVL